MSRSFCVTLIIIVAFCASGHPAVANERGASERSETPPEMPHGLQLETLLKKQLEGVEDTEVIVSRVTIPANTSLPKHWHPGEEFAYVLEGTVVLWQENKDDIVGKAGDVVMIPLKQIHTAMTGDEGATVLVFRVHEQGEPERITVE